MIVEECFQITFSITKAQFIFSKFSMLKNKYKEGSIKYEGKFLLPFPEKFNYLIEPSALMSGFLHPYACLPIKKGSYNGSHIPFYNYQFYLPHCIMSFFQELN